MGFNSAFKGLIIGHQNNPCIIFILHHVSWAHAGGT